MGHGDGTGRPGPGWDAAPGDARTTLAELQGLVLGFCEERDWARYHNPRNLAMALSVEVGELLELYLWSSDAGPQPPVASRVPKVAEELADVAICLLNLSARAEVDLAAAVRAKLAANAEKYPVALARGRLQKSTELAALPPVGSGEHPTQEVHDDGEDLG